MPQSSAIEWAWDPRSPNTIAPATETLDPILTLADFNVIKYDEEAKGLDLAACCGSPWYWMVNHVVTLDEHDDTGHPYKRFPAKPHLQAVAEDWWWCGLRYPILAFPKSRKQIMTWVISLLFFGECQFRAGRRNIVQSQDEDESKAIIEKMHGVWNRQAPWIRTGAEWTTSSAKFANDSTFLSVPGGPSQLQGPTPSGYLMDEVGDHKEAAATFEAALAAVVGSSGTVLGGRRMVLVGRCPQSWWYNEFLADKLGAK